MHRRKKSLTHLSLLALCFFLSSASLAGDGDSNSDGSVRGWNALVYLMYQIEVTNYCGLTTDTVIAGFHHRQKTLLAEHPLSAALINRARAEAIKLAYREWDNRGLGGFRRWCQNDAARYAAQLTSTQTDSPSGATK